MAARKKSTKSKRAPAKKKTSSKKTAAATAKSIIQKATHKVSPEAKKAAEDAAASLPGRYNCKTMQALLVRTLYDGEFRREFRAAPKPILEEAGIPISRKVKFDIHENDENTIHLVLPGVSFDKIPRKGAGKPQIPLENYEKAVKKGIDLTDGEIKSGNGSEVALFNDDFTDDGVDVKKDPTARDPKGDGRTGGDTWDYFVNADNRDPTTRDTTDNADGTDRPEDTGKD